MSVQTLYTAATGMEAMETKLDVIANNLANINTTAFKKDRANFEDLLYRTEVYPGVQDASQTPTAVGNPDRARRPGEQHANRSAARHAAADRSRSRYRDPRPRLLASDRSLAAKTRCTPGLAIWTSTPMAKWSSDRHPPDGFSILPSRFRKTRSPSTIGTDGQVMTRVPGQVELTQQGQIQTGAIHQSRWPAQARREHVPRDRCVGSGTNREPRRPRTWTTATGQSGGFQRRAGQGIDRSDHDPACL